MKAKGKQKAVFLDKDGTLIPDIPYNVDPSLISISKENIEALKQFKQMGFRLVLITNQSGVAKGFFAEEKLQGVWQRLNEILLPHDVALDAFYYCPHHTGGTIAKYSVDCDCRKPLPGLILRAAKERRIDTSASWMIGDILNDVEAGRRAGCSSVLIDNGGETEWLWSEWRIPDHRCGSLPEAAQIIGEAERKRTRDGKLERV